MMPHVGDYAPLVAMVLVGVAFVAAAQVVGRFVRLSKVTAAKQLAYECGVEPAEAGWEQVPLRYHTFVWLYVLFAVESIFLFPWVVVFDIPEMLLRSAIEMGLFASLLALGLLYAWRKGALEWQGVSPDSQK